MSDVVMPVMVERYAATTPERTFLEMDDTVVTYADAHRQATQWAGSLAALGVGKGHTVLAMLPVSFESVMTWLAASWLHAIEVPINTDYRGNMLRYVIDDAHARVMVVHVDFIDEVIALGDALAHLEHVVVVGGPTEGVQLPGVRVLTLEELLNGGVAIGTVDPPQPYDIATIMYTSGTTGPSKGVMVPWAQINATATWTLPIDDLTADDAYYSPYPLFHIAGKLSVYTMAIRGARVVLRARFSTDQFWPDVRRHGCTTVILLGAVANFVFRQPQRPDDHENPLSNVCMVPLIPEVEVFKQRFDVRVCTAFNMTETSSPIISDGWNLANSSSCGRPRSGVAVRLVDEHDYPVAPGEQGELVVRTEDPWTLMVGYWGKPDKTVEAWKNQWFHTGDVFRVDEEGNYYFVDRRKDALRRRGENISSIEVELEINAHPSVLESAVVGVASEWGEEEVMAIVVPKPDADLQAADLHRFVVEKAPRFMVPRYIRIVDALPKTPTEKIRKTALRDDGVTADTWDAKA